MAVLFGLDGFRQDLSHSALKLRLERAGDQVILACHQGVETLLGDLCWVVFLTRAHLGVVHIRAVEEVGIGRSGHKRGDGYARVLQLVA
jgi:hypothetical protein